MAAALVGVCAAAGVGACAIGWSTAGFRALTYDGARAAMVAETPRPVPAVSAFAADGRSVPLFEPGTVTIVDFLSTACTSVCLAQGAAFARLQDSVRGREARGSREAGAPVRLVSVSFDPDDDDRRLAAYAESRGAMDPAWRIRRVAATDRQALLDAFGIVVVRDPVAGWRHNAAFHVVDARGSLTAIVPVEAPATALRVADAAALRARP
ncbi:MAG: SCO family protein [Gemmatimonadaceae bacterium]|jgi:protein SCO1/2|nr:SCO family protein [Gemmatimonadaceae bacterium]